MMRIFSLKNRTKRLAIRDIEDPSDFYIPLMGYSGPLTPQVEIGESILKYQLIASGARDGLAANIHAPVSGMVKAIEPVIMAGGSAVPALVIENDFSNRETVRTQHHPEKLTNEQILDSIFQAGVVGEGGAQFPTHLKYNTKGKHIETFIINGAECEPYLSADYALMHFETEKLLKAIFIVNKMLAAKEIVIAIEKQNRELTAVFHPYLKRYGNNIRIKILPDAYPQGGELQLIKSVTGKEVLKGTIPASVGIVVSNVGTIWAIYHALYEQKPSTERIVTISGDYTSQYGNFRIKIGTTLQHIIKTLGMDHLLEDAQLVLGGPMMGKAISDLSTPITKGSSAILSFKKQSIARNNCIQCGYCVDVCPQYLMPMEFVADYQRGNWASLVNNHLNHCIECGACEYICPSNVPLMDSIKSGKNKLKHYTA